jgi:hypothetical protein
MSMTDVLRLDLLFAAPRRSWLIENVRARAEKRYGEK